MRQKQILKRALLVFLLCMMVLSCFSVNTYAAKPKLNKTKATIYVGNKVTLKLKNASKVKWSSSKKSVATVSKKGVVTGIKAGKAVITARAAGKSYKATITVKASALNTNAITIADGKMYQLEVKNFSGKAAWSSSDASVVRVNKNGLISGMNVGQATVTAQVKAVTYRCVVTVVAALGNDDFNFASPDNDGFVNLIDRLNGIEKRKKEWETGIGYCLTRYYNESSETCAMENRGILIGDTYDDVIAAFGYNGDFVTVGSNDTYAKYFRNEAYPRQSIQYDYYDSTSGRPCMKRFYFDANDSLVLIIWRVREKQ